MTEAASQERSAAVADWMSSARAAWGAGDRYRAVRQWKRAMATSPDISAPYVNLARAHADLRVDSVWLESAAAALAGGDPLVARNLGVLAQQDGRRDAAMRHLRRSIVLVPSQTAALEILAKIPASDAHSHHDPLTWCVRAALTAAASPSTWFGVLSRLVNAGREDQATRWAAGLAIPLPQWPDELLRLALHLFTKALRNHEALNCAQQLVGRHPLEADARRVRALIRRRIGDLPGAVREARRAVLVVPGSFDNLCRAASELARTDDSELAIPLFRRALCVRPDRRIEIIENLGATYIKQYAADEASAALREALVHRPDRAQPYMNLSTLAFQRVDVAGAERFGRQSLMANPDIADACYNFAALRRHQGRLADARDLLDRAVSLEDRPTYRFLRALLELGDGDPEDGIRRYDARWEVPSFSASRRLGHASALPLPVWRGERLPQSTLAVWAEQGVGDEIWFSGYLPWAVGRVGRVVLEVAASLRELMQRSFPTVDVRARDAAGTAAALAAADMQVPLGGLMLPYGAGTKPVPTGYLRPDRQRVEDMRRSYLDGRRARRLIGISWRSIKAFRGRRLDGSEREQRSKRGRSFEAPLQQWRDLFAIEDAAFLALQYGDISEDARLVRDRFGVELIVDPRVDAYSDLDGFAAQVAAVDNVVSIANSTVAMAHALGKPVDVVPRIVQDDWRYARWSEATRWLPTARCSWQTVANDWTTPIGAVAERLRRDA